MKKLLCLLLACVCLLGLTSCKQPEEEKYYAYVSASFLDGFGAHNVYPKFVGATQKDYYQDETASSSTQVTVQGIPLGLQYDGSFAFDFYTLHYYGGSHEESGIESVSAGYRADGILGVLNVSYQDELAPPSQQVQISQAIEIAKKALSETAKIEFGEDWVISADGRYGLQADSDEYIIIFFKDSKYYEYVRSEQVRVKVRKDGKLTEIRTFGWGMASDDIDYDFDSELVEKALQERMENVYQDAEALFGEMRYFIDPFYPPYVSLDCDGTPMLHVYVCVYFVKDGEPVKNQNDGRVRETMLEYVVLKEPAKDEYLELAPGS